MRKSIFIVGIIASGKSEALSFLRQKYSDKIDYIEEPVKNNPYLEHMYDDSRYCFSNQVWMENKRIEDLFVAHNTDSDKVVVTDWGITPVFSKTMYKEGKLTKEQYDTYSSLVRMMPSFEPSIYIYIKSDIDVAFNRIRNIRKRECESTITREYLSNLDKEYEEYMFVKQNKCIIHNNASKEDLEKKVQDIWEKYIG